MTLCPLPHLNISAPHSAKSEQHTAADYRVKARMLLQKVICVGVNLIYISAAVRYLCLKKCLCLGIVRERLGALLCRSGNRIKVCHIKKRAFSRHGHIALNTAIIFLCLLCIRIRGAVGYHPRVAPTLRALYLAAAAHSLYPTHRHASTLRRILDLYVIHKNLFSTQAHT